MDNNMRALSKHMIVLLIAAYEFASCMNGYSPSGGGSLDGGDSTKIIRIGGFNGQNGVTVFGQLDLLQDTATGYEKLEIHNDFIVSGVSGTIQFWLSDSVGSLNLAGSSVKTIVSSLDSGYSGAHIFDIPNGYPSSDYGYVTIFSLNNGKNIAAAKLVLPDAPLP